MSKPCSVYCMDFADPSPSPIKSRQTGALACRQELWLAGTTHCRPRISVETMPGFAAQVFLSSARGPTCLATRQSLAEICDVLATHRTPAIHALRVEKGLMPAGGKEDIR